MRFTLTVEGEQAPLLPITTARPEVEALKLPEVLKLGSDKGKGGGLAGVKGSRKQVGNTVQFTFTNAQRPERPAVIVIAAPVK